MSITKRLERKLGGKWTWDGHATWWCDDGKRLISRCSAGVDEFDYPLGPPQWWLYGDGVPRRAEEYVFPKIEPILLNLGDL